MLATLRRLAGDKVFALAVLAGPLFWWVNHQFSLSNEWAAYNWQLVLLFCLIYPLLEELTFRGAIQGGILLCAWGRVTRLGLTQANWLCSLLFALTHLYSQNLLWSAAVFFPSLVFGLFRDRYNSTLASIILHCFYNSGFLLLR